MKLGLYITFIKSNIYDFVLTYYDIFCCCFVVAVIVIFCCCLSWIFFVHLQRFLWSTFQFPPDISTYKYILISWKHLSLLKHLLFIAFKSPGIFSGMLSFNSRKPYEVCYDIFHRLECFFKQLFCNHLEE
jgi:hypothetical protein